MLGEASGAVCGRAEVTGVCKGRCGRAPRCGFRYGGFENAVNAARERFSGFLALSLVLLPLPTVDAGPSSNDELSTLSALSQLITFVTEAGWKSMIACARANWRLSCRTVAGAETCTRISMISKNRDMIDTTSCYWPPTQLISCRLSWW